MRPLDREHREVPGTVLETRGALVVACGRGALEIRALKPAGKGRMEALAWLQGARIELGARFGAIAPKDGPGAAP